MRLLLGAHLETRGEHWTNKDQQERPHGSLKNARRSPNAHDGFLAPPGPLRVTTNADVGAHKKYALSTTSVANKRDGGRRTPMETNFTTETGVVGHK